MTKYQLRICLCVCVRFLTGCNVKNPESGLEAFYNSADVATLQTVNEN